MPAPLRSAEVCRISIRLCKTRKFKSRTSIRAIPLVGLALEPARQARAGFDRRLWMRSIVSGAPNRLACKRCKGGFTWHKAVNRLQAGMRDRTERHVIRRF